MLNDSSRDHGQSSDVSHTGSKKADRYGWAKLGTPGELVWVAPQDLRVDHGYQRSLKEDKVKEIVANFSWPAFGVLLLARRRDGVIFVPDGQHRCEAAVRRGIKKVPGVRFDIDDEKEEALAFLGSNTLRKPLSAVDKHKAKVLSGDAPATMIAGLLAKHGRFVSGGSQANGTNCLAKLEKLAEEHPTHLEKIWPLLMQLTDGEYLQEKHVGPLVYIDRHSAPGSSITDPVWSKKLLSLGARGVIREVTEAAVYHKRGGDKVWAIGLVQALNRGQRTRKFVVNWPAAGVDPNATAD